MKKLLLLFVFVLSFTSIDAQTYLYKAQSFASRYVNEYGRWTNWSSWKPCDILISIDTTNDIIKIYSQIPQVYVITTYVRSYSDNKGGNQMEFKVIDQDYDSGTIRIRIESNGTSQLYVDFADISWVYGNVVKY